MTRNGNGGRGELKKTEYFVNSCIMKKVSSFSVTFFQLPSDQEREAIAQCKHVNTRLGYLYDAVICYLMLMDFIH